MTKAKAPTVSSAGTAYLKCSTSPNDFEMDAFTGIPDEYDGRVVVKRFSAVNTTPAPSATLDTYIVLLPTPGVAFWYGSRAGTAAITLVPVLYSDAATLFPVHSESSVVSAFRYASHVIEIVPTVNAMSWGGAIEVWKAPIRSSLSAQPMGEMFWEFDGFQAINSSRPQSVLPFNNGIYTITAPIDPSIPFVAIADDVAPSTILPRPSSLVTLGGSTNIVGLGNRESVIIKIPAGNLSNTALIRTWACLELAVSSESALYEYSHISPMHDPLALALLRKFVHSHPVAVPFYDNAGFWDTFLSWVRTSVGPSLKMGTRILRDAADVGELVGKKVDTYM